MCEKSAAERKPKAVPSKMRYFVSMRYRSAERVTPNSATTWNPNPEMSGGVSRRWRGEW